MTATAEPPAPLAEAPVHGALDRAAGVELLGPVHGCGYRDGACLVRRADGQMVQLGTLMYALLESIDGRRDSQQLAVVASERLGRRLEPEHVVRLAQKLAAQGLLAGTEDQAPPRRNPLLALRWKVLVTNPRLTRRLTAPFTILFRPWIMWPILAAFAAVFWFVLFHKGVASATSQAFRSPGLLLLVFVLAVFSAGFHELGHAAACRYGGATPGGMGMGMYLVWPAFYTDVTDAYRLPKRARLRVDLAGLYFNAAVSVATMGLWLIWRADALLLLVALQILQMVKQLSPVIRADGYHILSDATGVPDLYSQMGPTLRRLLPGQRHAPTTLTGRARLLVTVWVLIIVPVLISLSLSAILLLPHLVTSAFDSGRHIVLAIPGQADHGQILSVLASVVRLLALSLPVFGSVLVTQKVVRTTATRALSWSRGHAGRRAAVLVATLGVIAGLIWAWWPAGQYQPIRATRGGTVAGLVQLVSSPASVARPAAAPAPVALTPGTHFALVMVPVDGASARHPALFVIAGSKGHPAVAIESDSTPKLPAAALSAARAASSGGGSSSTGGATSVSSPSVRSIASNAPAAGGTTAQTVSMQPTVPVRAAAFLFKLPPPPGPHGSQAVATGTRAGGVTYAIAYGLVTVTHGAPVDETNGAYALASCQSCTTVAVSFQLVLVIGQSNIVAPVNVAEAINQNCPACTTTAIADQLVITLRSQPSKTLLTTLEGDLRQLNALRALGAGGTPAAVAAEVSTVQQQVETQLSQSGLLANPPSPGTSATSNSTTTPTTSSSTPNAAPGAPPPSASTSHPSSPAGSSSSSSSGAGSAGQATTTTTSTAPASTTTTTSPSQTSSGSSASSSANSANSSAAGQG